MPQHPAPFTIGIPFIELPVVESTNNYAMAMVHEGLAQPGMAIMAHEQTAGKGQRDKNWESGKNENINLSVIIKPEELLIANQFQLSIATALAAYQFIANYAGTDETSIKWPNDIYWSDRKAAGILVDNVLSQSSGNNNATIWKWSVIGTGININNPTFPAHLPHAISLKQITGHHYDITALTHELCKILDEYLHLLFEQNSSTLIDRYNSVLYKKDQPVKLKKNNRVFEVLVKQVNAKGQLIVQHGMEEIYNHGEIEWLL